MGIKIMKAFEVEVDIGGCQGNAC